MQFKEANHPSDTSDGAPDGHWENAAKGAAADIKVLRRDGSVTDFSVQKIKVALTKACLAVFGVSAAEGARVRSLVQSMTNTVVESLVRQLPSGGVTHIESIQDHVELALMRAGDHEVARAYIIYRQKHAEARAKDAISVPQLHATIRVKTNGILEALNLSALRKTVADACTGFEDIADVDGVLDEATVNLYDGVGADDVHKALILASRSKIELDPCYSKITARLLLDSIRQEIMGKEISQDEMAALYAGYFPGFLEKGVAAGLLNPELLKFDLQRIGAAMKPERDLQFTYLGLQTLYDRYFLHIDDVRIEMPQAFFMRVSMGLALEESNRTDRAIEFYELLSSFDFMSSTPTLFNSGTHRSQLSSCYLTTVPDSLSGIYDAIKENAMLSKFAGGLGNDWTNVRALRSHIHGTNGKSQGVVPFLKVVNDTAVAVNQGGKRKGAVCAYLETWHLDMEEFLELRKNTGDDRRRTHDMNTANWIPDLFMKRVMQAGEWTLFSPSDCPDLHDKFGREFETAYLAYEAKADIGQIKQFKRLPAQSMWRRMITMLFETGHPWVTFKDPCNIRSPQQHVGVVHSSNLCTEITLNTSETEIAVCNLGSINLVAHLIQNESGKWVLDAKKLQRTITTAMRMLDNVIDINYYAVDKSRNANLKHRPVGMGIMGFQDCLHQMRIPYASQEAVEFSDRSMELVCYHAYLASSLLAKDRGRYETYEGSLWSRGILPQDSVEMLAQERGGYLEVDRSSTLDWTPVRASIRQHGMRNSNCVAIAPTATISNIIGVSACIEPTFENLFVKSNLAGEFTVVNEYLVRDLKELGIWDAIMISDLKHFDGSVAVIDRIPQELRNLYASAFEVGHKWIIECASRRQKWIDQAQSLNIYMSGASGKKLDETYKLAWVSGLKTTYYLRTVGATKAEKSTGRGGELNAVSSNISQPEPEPEPKFCSIDSPDCEACQ